MNLRITSKNSVHFTFKILLLIVFVAFSSSLINGQNIENGITVGDSTLLLKLKTTTGDKIFGYLLDIKEDSIIYLVRHNNEVYTFYRPDVLSIETLIRKTPTRITKNVNSNYHAIYRNVLFNSAIGAPKGTFEYNNTMGIFNQTSYTPTSFLTTSLSVMPIPFDKTIYFAGELSVFKSWDKYVHMKFSFRPLKGYLRNVTQSYLFYHPQITFGDHRMNLTIGTLYGLGVNEYSKKTPVRSYNTAAQVQLGPKWRMRLEVIYDKTQVKTNGGDVWLVLPSFSWSRRKNKVDLWLASFSIDDDQIVYGLPIVSYSRLLKQPKLKQNY